MYLISQVIVIYSLASYVPSVLNVLLFLTLSTNPLNRLCNNLQFTIVVFQFTNLCSSVKLTHGSV